MNEKLTVEELVKALRCCSRPNGDACNNCPGDKYKSCTSVMGQVADALESLAAERDGYKDKFKVALAENTRLAEKVEKWINPRFSKPKNGNKCVLVIVSGSAIGKDEICCTFFNAIELAFYANKKWFLKNYKYSDKIHIKRWMPLPKMPKEENNA